jgi:hypothetical protein
MKEWIEKVFGKHFHKWERLPGMWEVFDECDKRYPTTYWNVKCRCGMFLRIHSNGRTIHEPENLRRGVSEQFWGVELNHK